MFILSEEETGDLWYFWQGPGSPGLHNEQAQRNRKKEPNWKNRAQLTDGYQELKIKVIFVHKIQAKLMKKVNIWLKQQTFNIMSKSPNNSQGPE